LPTEAEWEYACRAGSQFAFANGPIAGPGCSIEPYLGKIGWYSANSGGGPRPVAAKAPNHWGLYDMHGNVWELTDTRYGPYPQSPVTDPTGPSSGAEIVIRGGNWKYFAQYARAADRKKGGKSNKGYLLGFRVVREE
jgi:formylglycine-generating enzyme required for sulfatase activity